MSHPPPPVSASDGDSSGQARRPIASRSSPWAIQLSRALARSGATPNQISVLSVVFAAVGGALIGLGAGPLAWIGAAVCVQLRLVCNLLDGMVAIEGGKASRLGPLYNEFPDRIADTLLLVPAGYAAGAPWIGWAAALAAALTAYVRAFGGAIGLRQDFGGIMAKQRRMALLTAALLAQSVEWLAGASRLSLLVGIAAVAAGSVVTCITRTIAMARSLEQR